MAGKYLREHPLRIPRFMSIVFFAIISFIGLLILIDMRETGKVNFSSVLGMAAFLGASFYGFVNVRNLWKSPDEKCIRRVALFISCFTFFVIAMQYSRSGHSRFVESFLNLVNLIISRGVYLLLTEKSLFALEILPCDYVSKYNKSVFRFNFLLTLQVFVVFLSLLIEVYNRDSELYLNLPRMLRPLLFIGSILATVFICKVACKLMFKKV